MGGVGEHIHRAREDRLKGGSEPGGPAEDKSILQEGAPADDVVVSQLFAMRVARDEDDLCACAPREEMGQAGRADRGTERQNILVRACAYNGAVRCAHVVRIWWRAL